MATPTFDTATNGGVTSNNTSKTTAHVAGTLTNGIAIIAVSTQDASIIHDTVTYGEGNAATQIGSTIAPADVAVSLWYYKNPPAGASDVIVNFGADDINAITLAVATYSNVNQTTPVGTPNSAINFDTTAPSEARVQVASAVGELVVAIAAFVSSTNTPTTSQNNRAATLVSGNHSRGFSDAAGASTVDMSWSDAGSFGNMILGVSLKPSADAAALSGSAGTGGLGLQVPNLQIPL